MCRVPPMDAPSSPRPFESGGEIAGTHGQEPAEALEDVLSRPSTPGSPPPHRRGQAGLSVSLPSSQPDDGGNNSATGVAEYGLKQSPQGATPAEPTFDEHQHQHLAAVEGGPSSTAAHCEEGATCCHRQHACTHHALPCCDAIACPVSLRRMTSVLSSEQDCLDASSCGLLMRN